MDVEASALAVAMGIPVAELLARADRLIEDTVKRDGIDAARGLTTRTRTKGQATVVTVSPRLADALQAAR